MKNDDSFSPVEKLIELLKFTGGPIAVPIVKNENICLLKFLGGGPKPGVIDQHIRPRRQERMPILLPAGIIMLSRAMVLFAGHEHNFPWFGKAGGRL